MFENCEGVLRITDDVQVFGVMKYDYNLAAMEHPRSAGININYDKCIIKD